LSLFKKVFDSLFSKKEDNKTVKNSVFEIPYNEHKTQLILMPNMNNQSFKISKWFYKVGEDIKEGNVIFELENEKVTLEFESLNSGKLVSISNRTSNLNYGDEICKIEKLYLNITSYFIPHFVLDIF
jgi:hypothetical protein